MCNLASEGGRCHAHIKQKITHLKIQDEQNLLEEASKAGVEIDTESVYQQMEDYDRDVESGLEGVEELKQKMLDAHAEAMEAKEAYKNAPQTVKALYNKVLYSEKFDDAFEKISSKLVMDEPSVRNPYELSELGDYPEKKQIIDAYQFKVAAQRELEAQEANIREIRTRHDEANDKYLKKHPDIAESYKLLERTKETWRTSDYSSIAYQQMEHAERAYNKVLNEVMKKEGMVSGGQLPLEQETTRLQALHKDVEESKLAYTGSVNGLYNHIRKSNTNPDNSHLEGPSRAGLETALYNSRASDTANYAKSRALHKINKFNAAKTDYVKTASEWDDPIARQSKRQQEMAHLAKYTFKEDALNEYQKTEYPKTESAKVIKSELAAEERQLVLTPTYRRNLKQIITTRELNGQDSSQIREKLERIEQVVARNKVNATTARREQMA